MRAAIYITACLLPNLFGVATSAFAQQVRDQVILLDPEDGSRTRIVCTVLDHTGEFLRYRIREDGPTSVRPASEVISIKTPQVTDHIQALKLYEAGKTDEAIASFEKALRVETRGWVRRDILAMLVKCALRQDKPAQAGERFLMIYGSDRTTQHVRIMPLLWQSKAPSPALKTVAAQWITESNSAAKLLGASALLFDPKYQSSATLELQRLRANPDERLRNLATAQLWRQTLPGQDIDDVTLNAWEDAIRSMPEEIRAGGYYLLGEGRKLRRQYDRAAAAFLWVPMVYPYDYQLAALCCLRAADSLNEVGKTTEALRLYREVLLRYSSSSYAQDARQMVEQLTRRDDSGS